MNVARPHGLQGGLPIGKEEIVGLQKKLQSFEQILKQWVKVKLEARKLMPYGEEEFAILVPKSFITVNGPLSLLRTYTVNLIEGPLKEVLVRETPGHPYEEWTRDQLIAALAERGGIEFSLAKRTSLKQYIQKLRDADVKDPR